MNKTSTRISKNANLKTSSKLEEASPKKAADASKLTDRYLLKKLEYITLQNIKTEKPAKIPAGIHLFLKDANNKNTRRQLTRNVGTAFADIPVK